MRQLTEYQRTLVAEHMDLVTIIIRARIHITDTALEEFDDFYQIGCEALCRAAITYDRNLSSFKTYASRVVYHALIDHCRKQNAVRNAICCEDLDTLEYLLPVYEECLDRLYAKELSAALLEAEQHYSGISLLGIKAIKLRAAGVTSKEIAAKFNTTINNVNAWISRARSKLSRDL